MANLTYFSGRLSNDKYYKHLSWEYGRKDPVKVWFCCSMWTLSEKEIYLRNANLCSSKMSKGFLTLE